MGQSICPVCLRVPSCVFSCSKVVDVKVQPLKTTRKKPGSIIETTLESDSTFRLWLHNSSFTFRQKLINSYFVAKSDNEVLHVLGFEKKMTCKNCDQTVEGNYCSHCGQSSTVGRITFSNFLKEISEDVFQINRGFFYTLKELSIRPGKSVLAFIEGKRQGHFKPIAYVLTLSTVYFLITQITHQSTWIDDALTGWMNGVTGEKSGVESSSIITWFAKNYAYSTLLLLPVFSLSSYLSFLKFGKNYLEHIVLNSYITGHQAIFYAFFAVGSTFFESSAVEPLPLTVAVFYTFWVFWQFFSAGSRTLNLLRSLLTYLLYLLFSVGFLVAFLAMNSL